MHQQPRFDPRPGVTEPVVLLTCVAGSRLRGRGAAEMDAVLVASAFTRAFGGMNLVCDRFGFPED